jgi:hypothetical protein
MKNFILLSVVALFLSSCATTSLPFSKEVIQNHDLETKMQNRLQLISSGEIILQKVVDTTVSTLIDGKIVEVRNTHKDDYVVKAETKGVILPGGNAERIEVTFGSDKEKLPYVSKDTKRGTLFFLDVSCNRSTGQCFVTFKNEAYRLVSGKYTYLVYGHEKKSNAKSEKDKAKGRKVGTDGVETKPKKAKKGEMID